MCVIQRVGQLAAVAQGRVERQVAACQQRTERFAGHELHGDIGLPASLADLVDGADVRMVERGRRARLPQQPCARVLVRELRGWQQLQRDVPVESIVMGGYTWPMPPAPITPALISGRPEPGSDRKRMCDAGILRDRSREAGGASDAEPRVTHAALADNAVLRGAGVGAVRDRGDDHPLLVGESASGRSSARGSTSRCWGGLETSYQDWGIRQQAITYRNAMEIPLDGLPMEGVDIRRWSRHGAPLELPRPRQRSHVLLGVEAFTREGWKHLTRGQGTKYVLSSGI